MLTVPLAGVPGGAQVVPEDAEPVLLSKPLDRGAITWHEDQATAGTPAAKTVDGDPSDWVGHASRLGGTTVLDRGELIYQGFLFDDFGADDGKDAQRNQDLTPVYEDEPRTERVEALTQAAGEQFGADEQDPTDGYLTGPANYGDAVYPAGTEGQADLVELRLAADDGNLYVMARTTAMADASVPALVLLLDTGRSLGGLAADHTFGTGLAGGGFDTIILAGQGTLDSATLGTGHPGQPIAGQVAVDAAGTTNTIEVALPLEQATNGTRVHVAAGLGVMDRSTSGPHVADVTPGTDAANLLDVAFRGETTVSNWFDKDQAMALQESTLDPFSEEIDLAKLTSGTTIPWEPTPGYHSRVFLSDPAISAETPEQGPKETVWQHYGLYLPDAEMPESGYPMTVWLHWRGGTAHQAAAWTPRVVEQLGEERSTPNVVISPRGRGTSTWYTGAGHVDVLEAWDDVHELLDIDEDRRYVSGYSMGGYGSYLFGLLYPDKFAGAYPISGAMTQGLWAGVDDQGRDVQEANGGDADIQNTYRLVENARNLPYVIHHGTDDELVPVTGVQRMAAKFAELGYQYRFYRFLGYEHYTQAIVDEWKEGARYLDQQVREEDPARVVYKRIPALEHAIETFESRGADIDLDTDGAYWLTDLQPRIVDLEDPQVHVLADVTSHAMPDEHLTVPIAGAAALGHSTPYVMDGLAWTGLACIPEAPCPGSPATANGFDATFTNADRAAIDLARMGLDDRSAIDATVTVDGVTTVALEGDYSDGSTVTCGCGFSATTIEDGSLAITFEDAGTHEVTIEP